MKCDKVQFEAILKKIIENISIDKLVWASIEVTIHVDFFLGVLFGFFTLHHKSQYQFVLGQLYCTAKFSLGVIFNSLFVHFIAP